MFVLVRNHSCWVAGQGFEPWKASADGFTVRSHPTRRAYPHPSREPTMSFVGSEHCNGAGAVAGSSIFSSGGTIFLRSAFTGTYTLTVGCTGTWTIGTTVPSTSTSRPLASVSPASRPIPAPLAPPLKPASPAPDTRHTFHATIAFAHVTPGCMNKA